MPRSEVLWYAYVSIVSISIMVCIYINSIYTSDRELPREITLEDMKMYGSTPRNEDEVNAKKT